MRFGTHFYKMSGSGNDFLAFDEMALPATDWLDWRPDVIQALCRRGTGVGADGIFLLRSSPLADFELVYFNADGTRAALCGNASLCAIRLAVELGHAPAGELRFQTDDGTMTGRMGAGPDAVPEFDLMPASRVQPDRSDLREAPPPTDEHAIGYAVAGVPHVVVLCADAGAVDLSRRAPHLRHHPSLAGGANVNFVSQAGPRWRIRTFERGVEGETLACGTGSVATALLLSAWGLAAGGTAADGAGEVVELATSSGLTHRVRLSTLPDGQVRPSLAGAARIVYRGELGEVARPPLGSLVEPG
jgi:diaminopimelate epimerase